MISRRATEAASSGIIFATLLLYVGVDDLLFWRGAILTVTATALFIPLARAESRWSFRQR